MTSGLTPRMAQCLKAIRELTVDGVPPSILELQTALRDKNRGQVHATLCELKGRGAIDWTPKARRSLRIIERPSRADLERLSDDDLRAVWADIDAIVDARDTVAETGLEPRP